MRQFKVLDGRAFSLLEALLAMLLVTGGVISVVQVMSSGMTMDQAVETQMVSLKYAQEKMEAFKDLPFASQAGTTTDVPATGYSRTYTVLGADPKTVTVTVTKQLKGNLSVSLTTKLTGTSGS